MSKASIRARIWEKAHTEGRTVRCDSLRRGERFVSMTGDVWIFDHEHNGCCWVRGANGTATNCFAGCADVWPTEARQYLFRCGKHDAVGMAPHGRCPLCVEAEREHVRQIGERGLVR